ncbi:uncharacterized protein BDR25DRAFT_307642 [Lindgomyces ingoldianus]|uniref:Uncharacterized protein n=1 Tax=Lindgomyces ingoldianus TaxID=673940 RepID=A0ACB6Q984_9PLEO|nr:uncharacterized protein BDR25DRAFT_307642 [Lindgomyces ingoldianus]KAF2463589.1 hypothetical protein BDR25DRAFT_307642 [Lindgomyces ingoldianus]
MGDSGATTAMATPFQQPKPDHDDPLTLNEYGLPELRTSLQSPSIVGNSPTTIMPSFADFPPLGFGQAQGFNAAYERSQMGTSPTVKSSFRNHRGSISNMSDENISAGSAHPHRLSISSMQNFGQDENNTSPESGPALGMLAIGENLNDGLNMKLDDSVNGDGAEGSTTSKKDKDGNTEPPPWSEMKTKAGKERKRLPLACIACRRKKIRCSGEKPACKHCLRSRIPCVYKVTTRKAAPRTDYMAMLDKRLKRMEDRVIKLIPRDSLPSVSGVGRSVVKPALPGAPPKTPSTKKRPAEEAFGAELDEWSKSKSANPDTASASRAKDTDENRLLTEGAESLPSKEIQEHLAEVYFDYVYGQSYPLLHKPSFMRRLASGNVPPVLILAICAISARFSTHPQLRTEPAFLRGDNWGERAREIALKRYDAPNITILIVYLLLGLHEFGTCQGGRSWMFGGMAQRMAYALQLHKELEYDPSVAETERKPLSLTDREIRRRTMWSCFLMDRFNSSGTDRPLFVNEQYIEVQLPVKEHLYIHEIRAPTENLEGNVPNPVPPDSGQLSNPRDNMGVASYTIRLVCIWGKLVKYMNLGGKERESEPMWSPKSTFLSLKREAKEYKESLPEMLLYSPENLKSHAIGRTANQFLYLHILYQQIILFMHRFSLPSTAGSRPPKDMPHDFLTESARTALDAANQISNLINESMDYNVVAPFAGYSAFFSSTVHVHGVFSKNPKLEAQSKKYLAYNVKYLSKMKKYWGMFHYIAENLKDLYRQHADAVLRGPTATGDKKGKGMIFQYGDWFDRYPHGVSKTDYEDAAESLPNEPGTDAVLGQKSDLQSVEEFFASLSPPSRAEQQRKMARKNKSKSVSKADVPTSQASEAAKIQPQTQQIHPSHLQQQMGHMQIPQDPMDTSAFDPAYFSQANPQQSFIPDFPQHQHPQPHVPMLSTSPTSLISPHQMDVSSYSDIPPHSNAASFWGIQPVGLGGNGYFSDPSTAWFLPFNMEPPTLGDDGGVFGGGEAFNFGLTPGPGPVDIAALNGHAHHRASVSHAQGGQGLEGLDLDGGR